MQKNLPEIVYTDPRLPLLSTETHQLAEEFCRELETMLWLTQYACVASSPLTARVSVCVRTKIRTEDINKRSKKCIWFEHTILCRGYDFVIFIFATDEGKKWALFQPTVIDSVSTMFAYSSWQLRVTASIPIRRQPLTRRWNQRSLPPVQTRLPGAACGPVACLYPDPLRLRRRRQHPDRRVRTRAAAAHRASTIRNSPPSTRLSWPKWRRRPRGAWTPTWRRLRRQRGRVRRWPAAPLAAAISGGLARGRMMWSGGEVCGRIPAGWMFKAMATAGSVTRYYYQFRPWKGNYRQTPTKQCASMRQYRYGNGARMFLLWIILWTEQDRIAFSSEKPTF